MYRVLISKCLSTIYINKRTVSALEPILKLELQPAQAVVR